jgi:PrtD family type I secretion system ABC transporter
MKPETELSGALKACRSTVVALIFSSACSNLLSLAAPLYMMHVYDHVLTSRSIETLVMLTLITGAAFAALCLLDALRSHIVASVGTWLDERLGACVIGAGLRMTLRNGGTVRTSDGLRDLTTIRGFLAGPAITPLIDAPWAPIFVIALFLLHPLLGWIGLVSGVVIFGLALLNELATKAPLRAANIATHRSLNALEAAFRNAEVIHAMGMTDGVVRLWRRQAKNGKMAHMTATRRGAVILACSKFFRMAIQSGIMGAGAWLVIDAQANPGILFGSTFLLARALAPVENAMGTWKSLVSARLAYERLSKLLETAPEPTKGMSLPRPTGRLTVEQAVFRAPGAEAPILRGISMNAEPGEVIGVIGPSAAGKSSLARLIAGTWRASSGVVRLDNADIAVWLASGGAKYVKYLPQDVELFAGSVKDNIARLGDAHPDEVIKAAKLVGLHEIIMGLPQAYDTEIGEAGVRLSGGQRQRVALARALFGDPQLVILDEPNSSLDSEGDDALVDALGHLKARGATVVVIAHRPSILYHADKLLVLRGGTVAAFGPRDEVVAHLNGNVTAAPRATALTTQRQTA